MVRHITLIRLGNNSKSMDRNISILWKLACLLRYVNEMQDKQFEDTFPFEILKIESDNLSKLSDEEKSSFRTLGNKLLTNWNLYFIQSLIIVILLLLKDRFRTFCQIGKIKSLRIIVRTTENETVRIL